MQYLSRPWEAPTWLLVIFVAVNRLILHTHLGVHGFSWQQAVPRFGRSLLEVLALGFIWALCMHLAMRLVRSWRDETDMGDLFELALRSQAPYLLAAPLTLLAAGFAGYFDPERLALLVQSLRGLLGISFILALYFLLKSRYRSIGELGAVTLAVSPYLALLALAAISLMLFLSLVAGSIAYFSLRV